MSLGDVPQNEARIFQAKNHRVTLVFLLFLISTFASAIFTGLPLLIAALSLATSLRNHKWIQITLWSTAAILTVLQLAVLLPWGNSAQVSPGTLG